MENWSVLAVAGAASLTEDEQEPQPNYGPIKYVAVLTMKNSFLLVIAG